MGGDGGNIMNTAFRRNVQELVFDARQGAWIAIGHDPSYRRAGKFITFLRHACGAAKIIGLIAGGFWIATWVFSEASIWSRFGSAVTGNFPMPF